ncbi:hypothetical protein EMIT0P218_130001 [Pseudomonas sp. IT-P218]
MFFALEGQDVEDGVEPADGKFVASVVEKDARWRAHGQSFLVCGGNVQEGFCVHPGPDG